MKNLIPLFLITMAVLAILPGTVDAFTSPVSPLPTPEPICGANLGCSVIDGVETCSWLMPDGPPEQWHFDMIDQHQCEMRVCPALEGSVLTCSWDVPATPTPTLTPEWLHSRHPEPEPTTAPTATPEPTPVPVASTWTDAGLWQGVYVLLINEAGLYCLPELAECP